jgi:hypothetical protein
MQVLLLELKSFEFQKEVAYYFNTPSTKIYHKHVNMAMGYLHACLPGFSCTNIPHILREAARHCRVKKKEYLKCLEERVQILEGQNKKLIDELKALKEFYTQHKKDYPEHNI